MENNQLEKMLLLTDADFQMVLEGLDELKHKGMMGEMMGDMMGMMLEDKLSPEAKAKREQEKKIKEQEAKEKRDQLRKEIELLKAKITILLEIRSREDFRVGGKKLS